MDMVSLDNPDLYINRELAQLEFNGRVLELAQDHAIPLLERLRYLCISSTIMDEFFEVRVAGLKQQIALNIIRPGADGLSPADQLRRVSESAHTLVEHQYRVFNDVLIPALKQENIRFIRRQELNPKQAQWVKQYFRSQVSPVLSPLGLDSAHPFPRVVNKQLNLVVTLQGVDPYGRDSRYAVVQAPRSLPRVIRLPAEISGGPHEFIFLSSIIHENMNDLFPGMTITGSYQFRVTRNSELFVDEEESENLLSSLKGELPLRNYGQGVRLEVADDCPQDTAEFIMKQFQLEAGDLYRVAGPVNLSRLAAAYDLVDRPDLKFPPFTPSIPVALEHDNNYFDVIRQRDILLHHPYQSFVPVVNFLRQAAVDPKVIAIKQTLYRTGNNSVLVDALVEAARNGKEVTAVVELRARFDEETNINLADRLHLAGCQVVYGIVGYKTHAKMCIVVRREGEKLVRYVHLGTGNYHAGTARAYTDYGFFSCDPQMAEDVHQVFRQITGPGNAVPLDQLLQAPFSMHARMCELVAMEAEHARAGRRARIMAKMNALVEPKIIHALYRASQLGVKIDLIVRGVCCLRPGVAGVSENIQVHSILGRFLEHTRVFYFYNNGDPLVYSGSADWMPRNFFQRVEVAFPVKHRELRQRVIEESLENYLQDNQHSWQLNADGSYIRHQAAKNEKPHIAQQQLLEIYAKEAQQAAQQSVGFKQKINRRRKH